MSMEEYIKKYIDLLSRAFDDFGPDNVDDDYPYVLVREVIGVFSDDVPNIKDNLILNNCSIQSDVHILIGILKKQLIKINDGKIEIKNVNKIDDEHPLIFISHNSKDKKYGDALCEFITGLGVNKEQLIYTSDPLHKIPLDDNIFEYLKNKINNKIFMMFLLSNDYFKSSACLNEMGAAWIVNSDYSCLFVPTFDFNNTNFNNCCIDSNKMGISLNGDENCETGMIELKNKIQKFFQLENDEIATHKLLKTFIKKIKEISKNG